MKNKIIALVLIGILGLTGCSTYSNPDDITTEDVITVIESIEKDNSWKQFEKISGIDMKQRIISNISSQLDSVGVTSEDIAKLADYIYIDTAKALEVTNVELITDETEKKVYNISYNGLNFDLYNNMICESLSASNFIRKFEAIRSNNVNYTPIIYPATNITLLKNDKSYNDWNIVNDSHFNKFINSMCEKNFAISDTDVNLDSPTNSNIENSKTNQYVWDKYPNKIYNEYPLYPELAEVIKNEIISNDLMDDDLKFMLIDLGADEEYYYGKTLFALLLNKTSNYLEIISTKRFHNGTNSMTFPVPVSDPYVAYYADGLLSITPGPHETGYSILDWVANDELVDYIKEYGIRTSMELEWYDVFQ